MTQAQAVVPTALLKTRPLGVVRESAWAAARQRRGHWQEAWDMAVWLRFSDTPASPVALVLRYTDDDGAHALIVEEAKATPGSVEMMFSGRITLKARGKLSDMSLHCSGVAEHLSVVIDNLHVKPVPQPVEKTG